MSSGGATLQGSFSGATGSIDDTGFIYGTSSGVLPNQVSSGSTSSPFSKALTGLTSGTTYYYKAYVHEYDESASAYVYRYGSEQSFSTPGSVSVPVLGAGWLELPDYSYSSLSGTSTSSFTDLYAHTHKAMMGGVRQRNYSLLYDPEMYASYWVAYPLCSAHCTSGRTETWAYDPDVPSAKQTLASSGYGVAVSTPNYASNSYGRGHQIPNADRNAVDAMQAQTYYYTNLTPQIQNGFNGGIWNDLEEAVRALLPGCDPVYVVTGAAFRKKTDGTEGITKITNGNDSKKLPLPNYYWKALLKVKRSAGVVTSASAIGFWLPHNDLKGEAYADYTVSVDQLESWTGLDLFHNLSAALQTSCETNSNWTTFRSF